MSLLAWAGDSAAFGFGLVLAFRLARAPRTAKAEFVAASLCGQVVGSLQLLLHSLGLEEVCLTPFWEDTAACILVSEDLVHPCRALHIDMTIRF